MRLIQSFRIGAPLYIWYAYPSVYISGRAECSRHELIRNWLHQAGEMRAVFRVPSKDCAWIYGREDLSPQPCSPELSSSNFSRRPPKLGYEDGVTEAMILRSPCAAHAPNSPRDGDRAGYMLGSTVPMALRCAGDSCYVHSQAGWWCPSAALFRLAMSRYVVVVKSPYGHTA